MATAKRAWGGRTQRVHGRLERCRAAMAEAGIDGFLVTHRMDHFYLTGFTGEDSAVLITPRQVHVITDGRFRTSSESEVRWARRHFRKVPLFEMVGTVVRKIKLRTLHVQPSAVTVEGVAQLRKFCKPARVANAPDIVGGLRHMKDDGEVKAIEGALRVAEDAFRATRRTIRPGMSERDIAAKLEYEMRRRGASGAAFPTIVAEGPNAALPHAMAGDRKVRRGSAVLIDWGAVRGFYRSDLTRMVFVGSIPPKIRRVYTIVREAQERAIAAIRPGETTRDIDAVARRHIRQAGFGKAFGHGLGHGLGLETHEPPRVSWMSKEKLAAGMIVTVEPGIYLPGVGGVRIEDDVLVTPTGCRVLSHLSKDLEEAVV